MTPREVCELTDRGLRCWPLIGGMDARLVYAFAMSVVVTVLVSVFVAGSVNEQNKHDPVPWSLVALFLGCWVTTAFLGMFAVFGS